jgi:hypothetical protein
MTRLSCFLWSAAMLLAATACMTYRGPRGVEDSLERSLSVELKRDVGIKLGPISTRFVASLSSDDGHADFDFHGLTSVGVVVYERGHRNGRPPHRIEPKDLGLTGYTTMLSSSDGDDQVLILAKRRGGSIHDMVLLTVDADEVVVARLTGHLDALIAKAMDKAKSGGAHGVRGAVPLAN